MSIAREKEQENSPRREPSGRRSAKVTGTEEFSVSARAMLRGTASAALAEEGAETKILPPIPTTISKSGQIVEHYLPQREAMAESEKQDLSEWAPKNYSWHEFPVKQPNEHVSATTLLEGKVSSLVSATQGLGVTDAQPQTTSWLTEEGYSNDR